MCTPDISELKDMVQRHANIWAFDFLRLAEKKEILEYPSGEFKPFIYFNIVWDIMPFRYPSDPTKSLPVFPHYNMNGNVSSVAEYPKKHAPAFKTVTAESETVSFTG
jgi:hypothetical protein